ncbi:MAG: bifunctional diguanylate cyclase/phosphodiesterase [Kangiellaceae bacterium]
MLSFITVTYVFQVTSALIIAMVLLKYFKVYNREYLKCWSLSFYSLAVFLMLAAAAQELSAMGMSYTSIPMFILSLVKINAGYLQMCWLLMGTLMLGKSHQQQSLPKRPIVLSVMIFATVLGSLYAFDPEGGWMRNLFRSGSRYLFGGLAFLIAFVITLKLINRDSLGKWLVSLSFLVYGIEMTTMGVLNVNLLFGGPSDLLVTLVSYHGLMELLIYPTIALGLVIWFLEHERRKGQLIYEKLAIINDSDPLTGLANQRGFERLLTRWQTSHTESDAKLLVVLIGIDQFKRINQSGGVRQGDKVLVAFADRMTEKLGSYANQARISGDVFGCVLNEKKADKHSLNWLTKQFSRPLLVNEQTIHIDVSIGATWMDPSESVDEPFLRAQRALDAAKKMGGRKALLFDESMPKYSDTLELESQLREAIAEKQFEIYLQPIYSMDTERVVGYEALTRWNHPRRGVLTPFEFLPHLGPLNLLPTIDLWALAEAIELLKSWQREGLNDLFIAVNSSAESLQDDHYLATAPVLIKQLKNKSNNLHIEVTENSAIKSINAGKQTLSLLSETGINISIDDFGTGYSSLNYLKSLPAHKVKFDRSFIREMLESKASLEILKALVPLCQKLDKVVVAEGIETQEQLDMVREIGFNQLQGFLFSVPLPVSQATKLVVTEEKAFASR